MHLWPPQHLKVSKLPVSNEEQQKKSSPKKLDDASNIGTCESNLPSLSKSSSSQSGTKESSIGHKSTDDNSSKKEKLDLALTEFMKLLGTDSPKVALVAANKWLQLAQKGAPEKEIPPSPTSLCKSISKVAYKKTLKEHHLENALKVGISPKWNGEKDKFFHFQQHILLKRHPAAWSPVTIIKFSGKKINFISYPWETTV